MAQNVPPKHKRTLMKLLLSGEYNRDKLMAATGLSASSVAFYVHLLRQQYGKFPRLNIKWTFEKMEELSKEVHATGSYTLAGKKYGIGAAYVCVLMKKYTELWVEKQREKDYVD